MSIDTGTGTGTGTDTGSGTERPSTGRSRRAWTPELDAEIAGLLRLLAWRCWLVAGRDDDAIAAVRRNEAALRAAFGRLGWVLVVERDLVRLRKSPPPRPQAWAVDGPDPLTCSWFFLLVAAAESLPPRVGLHQLVTAARAAAADADVQVHGTMPERRATVAALKLLDERGVIEQLEGDIDGYLADDNPPVLLAVHHTRLLHVIANAGASDPSKDTEAWLESVRREPDAARRMRRRLVDDALVHTSDLDEAEQDWLSRRLRGDDGGPLADAFGLEIERRAEGAAFVVPEERYRYDRELGPRPFPAAGGTVPHAALLLCDHASGHGTPADRAAGAGPGPGWRGLRAPQVLTRLTELGAQVGSGRGGWSAEMVENPHLLMAAVRDLLLARDLVRVTGDSAVPGDRPDDLGDEPAGAPGESGESGETEAAPEQTWWFSPATGRWPAPAAAPAVPVAPRTRTETADEQDSLFATEEKADDL